MSYYNESANYEYNSSSAGANYASGAAQAANYSSGAAQAANYSSGAAQAANYSAAASYNDAGGQDTSAQSYEGYTPQEPAPFNVASIQLPSPNASCYQPPGDMKGQVRHVKHNDENETKNIEQTFNDTKQATRENIVHHQHNKNVLYNVNRNHNHLIKVVNKDSNFHHHLINNIVRVNDIHHQRIEQVRGEGRTSRDFKQTHRVEAGGCRRGADSGDSGAAAAAASIDDSSSVAQSAAAAWQQQLQSNSAGQWQQGSSQQQAYGASNGSANYANYSSNGAYRRY